MKGNLIVNTVTEAGPNKNHKTWMFCRSLKVNWNLDEIWSFSEGQMSPEETKAESYWPQKQILHFSAKASNAQAPPNKSHISTLLLLKFSHISRFWELGSQVVRWTHRDCPVSCCPSVCDQCLSPQHKPPPPCPQPYKLFRRSYCTWWLIYVLRSGKINEIVSEKVCWPRGLCWRTIPGLMQDKLNGLRLCCSVQKK